MNVNFQMCVFDEKHEFDENTKLKDLLFEAAKKHARSVSIKFGDKYNHYYNFFIPYEYINNSPNFLVTYDNLNYKKFLEWVEKEYRDLTIKQWFNLDKEQLK